MISMEKDGDKIMKYGDIVIYKDEVGKVVDTYGKTGEYRFLPCNYGTYYSEELDVICEDDIREATHEEKRSLLSKEYHWGHVIDVHCIGEYQIIESVKSGTKHWHGYINYKDTNHSYSSLDSALIGCIARKHEGANGKAHEYFYKMVGMEW